MSDYGADALPDKGMEKSYVKDPAVLAMQIDAGLVEVYWFRHYDQCLDRCLELSMR